MSDFDDIRCLDAPLAIKLEAYAERQIVTNPIISEAYSDLVERLTHAGAGEQALGVGDRLPSFALPDSLGHVRRLEDFLSDGPLVLSFNRGHWCSFCRLELLSLNDNVQQIEGHHASLISIMPERATHTLQLQNNLSLNFPILTDIDNGYALQLGLMIALGQAISDLFRERGNDITRFQGNDAWFVPIPATYVIAPDGIITAAYVDPDFRRRMPTSDILSALNNLAV